MRVSHSSEVFGRGALVAAGVAAWPASVGMSVVSIAARTGVAVMASATVISFSFMAFPSQKYLGKQFIRYSSYSSNEDFHG